MAGGGGEAIEGAGVAGLFVGNVGFLVDGGDFVDFAVGGEMRADCDLVVLKVQNGAVAVLAEGECAVVGDQRVLPVFTSVNFFASLSKIELSALISCWAEK